MGIQFLGAVFIRVSNLDVSIPFYSDVLGLQLRDVEQWDEGRGANYFISEHSPLLTLIETDEHQPLKYPAFNLNCSNVTELYDLFKQRGIQVGDLNNWSSEMHVHQDFDVYDPDGNPINLIEWRARTDNV
ncbi:VOC family protein [Paenibacillus marinisediminis]